MIGALVLLAIIALVDLVTTWQFSMLVFYSFLVYVLAIQFTKRVAVGFAILTATVSMLADLDSIPIRGVAGYSWSGLNRLGALLFAAGCGISFRNYRDETRRRLHALERAQELEREIVRAGEREQQRIGQDLHDGICQTLAALDCAAQCLKMDLETDGSSRVNLASEIQKHLSAATSEARSMARGIYPISIDEYTLPAALHDLVKTMNALWGRLITFHCEQQVVVKDSDVAMHVYRITQEALSNAMRHANATRIDVRVDRDDRKMIVSVADNGCGSVIQRSPEGMGQYTMRYRAGLIGAKISVHTLSGTGTTVRCSLPLPELETNAIEFSANPLAGNLVL